jgi:hypothetical protein
VKHGVNHIRSFADGVDERHIVVGNDNNLPFSSSRERDNEFVLLDVADLLRARWYFRVIPGERRPEK